MSATTAALGQPWSVVNTVVLIIVGACVVGIAIIVLLVFVGAKRRIMAVRTNFVPVLSQTIAKRQKRTIQEEERREVEFIMSPQHDPNDTLHGWFDCSVAEALGEDTASQLEQLAQEVALAWKEGQTKTEPRVTSLCTSNHPNERHLATLMVMSIKLVEKHAVAVSSRLAREPQQDVAAYVKHLEKTLHLEKRVCEKYIR